jgi:hypothetical protein
MVRDSLRSGHPSKACLASSTMSMATGPAEPIRRGDSVPRDAGGGGIDRDVIVLNRPQNLGQLALEFSRPKLMAAGLPVSC